MILAAAFPPPVAIEVKFCTAKRTNVPVGPAKFDLNRCNESPLRGEKPDFWPVSKFINTGSLPLRGILRVKMPLQNQLTLYAKAQTKAKLHTFNRFKKLNKNYSKNDTNLFSVFRQLSIKANDLDRFYLAMKFSCNF